MAIFHKIITLPFPHPTGEGILWTATKREESRVETIARSSVGRSAAVQPPTYAALGTIYLPTVQRTTSHRYLIRGEYDREETLDTAVISAERVELEIKAITGDLTIDSMVGKALWI